MNLVKVFDTTVRTVRHYHYTAWPDMGTPTHAGGIISFIKLIKAAAVEVNKKAPIVVHCRYVYGDVLS